MEELLIDEGGNLVMTTTYTSNNTWTKPEGAQAVLVEMWGAGGGAGGTNTRGAGGGGAGDTAGITIPSTTGGAGYIFGGGAGGTGLEIQIIPPMDTSFDILFEDMEEDLKKPEPVVPVNPKNRKKILFD